MNPYLELHATARQANDSFAVSAATLARDMYAAGQRSAAAGHAKLCRKRLEELRERAGWYRCGDAPGAARARKAAIERDWCAITV